VPDETVQASRLVVLAGPSGVGKGSVVARAHELLPDLWVSVSWATRDPRPGEIDGVHYHFVDDVRFRAEIAAGGFLEWAEYAGHYKGTPRAAVVEHLLAGAPALLEIDLQGARQVRAAMPEALQVFLKPPSLEELVRRLSGRGTETPEEIRHRMEIAEHELAAEPEFDATVVNDDVESAAERLVALITSP
jgi:guanylate kinase